jgi:hypothetical protein
MDRNTETMLATIPVAPLDSSIVFPAFANAVAEHSSPSGGSVVGQDARKAIGCSRWVNAALLAMADEVAFDKYRRVHSLSATGCSQNDAMHWNGLALSTCKIRAIRSLHRKRELG